MGDFTIEVEPGNKVTFDYLRILVTSKAKDGETLPFRTNCWFSTADGIDYIIHDDCKRKQFFSGSATPFQEQVRLI